jgi:hypothetical protein
MASKRNWFVHNNMGGRVWLSTEGDARRVGAMAALLSASIGRVRRHCLSHPLKAPAVMMRKDDQ